MLTQHALGRRFNPFSFFIHPTNLFARIAGDKGKWSNISKNDSSCSNEAKLTERDWTHDGCIGTHSAAGLEYDLTDPVLFLRISFSYERKSRGSRATIICESCIWSDEYIILNSDPRPDADTILNGYAIS